METWNTVETIARKKHDPQAGGKIHAECDIRCWDNSLAASIL